MTAAGMAAQTHVKPRVSFRKRAVRSSPLAAVSMGTNAKTMLLMSTEFRVSRGPMATASGLIFTAAAKDPHLRAFDADSGKELWSVELPASAQSTPMTYEWGGKQYVAICAGGHGKLKSKMGDSVIAFSLE